MDSRSCQARKIANTKDTKSDQHSRPVGESIQVGGHEQIHGRTMLPNQMIQLFNTGCVDDADVQYNQLDQQIMVDTLNYSNLNGGRDQPHCEDVSYQYSGTASGV